MTMKILLYLEGSTQPRVISIDTQTMFEKKEDFNNDDSLTSESLNRKRKSAEIFSENVKKSQGSSENVKKSRRISNAPKRFADFEMGKKENQPPGRSVAPWARQQQRDRRSLPCQVIIVRSPKNTFTLKVRKSLKNLELLLVFSNENFPCFLP